MSLERTSYGQEESHINTLPDEVLCMVFDYLDHKSVKNASLACQRWNNIIFLNGYISRFVFQVSLYSDRFSKLTLEEPRYETKRQILIREFKAMVEKSQRCYRKLDWRGVYSEKSKDNDCSSLWEAIHPKLTRNLHSLKFHDENSPMMLPLIADALPTMTQLRSLTIRDYNNYTIQDIIPTLRSNSLADLDFDSAFKCQLEMPHLETFYGRLSAFHLPIDIAHSFPLSNLKELSVTENMNSTQATTSVFRRLTHLEIMHWKTGISNEVLLKLCETCSTLKEIVLYEYYDEIDVNHLSKLTNLRVLEMPSKWELDLSTLVQVEEIHLVFPKHFVKLPTSMKKLTMTIFDVRNSNIISSIFNSCRHLPILEVIDYTIGNFSLPYLLKVLPVLENLEVLTIYNGDLDNSDFLCIDAPIDQLRELQLKKCNILTDRTIIEEKFPNVTELKFLQCTFSSDNKKKELFKKQLDFIMATSDQWFK